jgi:hypothetical protein
MPYKLVESLDVVKAAQRRLRSFLDERQDVGLPPVLSSSDGQPWWLFQETLQVTIESTQGVACVLAVRGGWAPPNQHNTARFPRLMTEFYADPRREDTTLDVRVRDAENKIRRAHLAFDHVLNRVRGGDEWWGVSDDDPGIRVVSSLRMQEIEYFPVPDGDGVTRAQVFYALVL